MQRVASSIALVLLLALPALAQIAPLPSQQDASAIAKARYEKGMAHFQLEEYDKAILEWEEGFRTRPVPEFLYNLAQAYRLSKVPERALTLYRRYLSMKPNAPNRGEVERHIVQLEKAVSTSAKAASAPPYNAIPARPGQSPPVAPTATTPASPPPTVQPRPIVAAVTPTPEPRPRPVEPRPTEPKPAAVAPTTTATTATTASTVTATPPARTPITKKGWFWGVVAGAIVVVGVGVGVGVAVGTAKTVDKANQLPEVRF